MPKVKISAPQSTDDKLAGGGKLPVSGVKSGGEPAKRDDPPKRRGRPRSAKNNQGAQHASGDAVPETQNTADQRVVRKKWSTNPATRKKQMAKAMPDFIQQYSNEAAIAQAMNVSRAEVSDVIASEPALVELMQVRSADREAILLDVIEHSAIMNGKSTDARWLLERMHPDRYVRKTGSATGAKKRFSAPATAPTELKSVLGESDEE